MVYYRSGYSPDDYPSEAEWAARKVLEQLGGPEAAAHSPSPEVWAPYLGSCLFLPCLDGVLKSEP